MENKQNSIPNSWHIIRLLGVESGSEEHPNNLYNLELEDAARRDPHVRLNAVSWKSLLLTEEILKQVGLPDTEVIDIVRSG